LEKGFVRFDYEFILEIFLKATKINFASKNQTHLS
jgi:hypothetical protein